MNGIYSTEFDKDWEMSKHYIDAVRQIAQRAENIDADQLYQIFDTKTIPEREESNKKLKTKQNKRQKKKNEKFVVAGLAKPKNVRNLFREQYHARCKAEGKEFDNANVLWVVLTFDNLFSQFKKKEVKPAEGVK
jgi:hypothetical protein